jgi:hypothetical protein
MTPDEMVSAACALIERRWANRNRLFFAIDGCAAAGKATLAKGIQASIGSASILRADLSREPIN